MLLLLLLLLLLGLGPVAPCALRPDKMSASPPAAQGLAILHQQRQHINKCNPDWLIYKFKAK
jgi:hypothetical protein